MRDSVGRRGAVLGLELHHHVVLLAVDLEARDLPPAQQRLQRAPDDRYVEPEVGHLVAVDLDRRAAAC